MLEQVNAQAVYHMAGFAEEMNAYQAYFQRAVDIYISEHVRVATQHVSEALGFTSKIKDEEIRSCKEVVCNCWCEREHLLQQEKIFAKAVNCEHPVDGNPCGVCASCRSIDNGSATDVLEMDAASNNGVDNIRDIRDEVVYSPSSMKYRVYIIDEVHMLSASAFNALLKTLEEPPEHVIFILATTELQKLPATIISRCQRFDFRRISTDVLVNRLTHIAKEEGITLIDEKALDIINDKRRKEKKTK